MPSGRAAFFLRGADLNTVRKGGIFFAGEQI
jgi:hypothetical protein